MLEQPQPAMVRFAEADPAVALLGRCHTDGEQGLIFGAATPSVHRQCRVKSIGHWQSYSLTTAKGTGLIELACLATEAEAEARKAPTPVASPAPVSGIQVAEVAEGSDDAWGMFAPLGASGHG